MQPPSSAKRTATCKCAVEANRVSLAAGVEKPDILEKPMGLSANPQLVKGERLWIAGVADERSRRELSSVRTESK